MSREDEPPMSRLWLALLAASVLCIVAVETILLALGTGFITSGFNTEHIDGWTLWLVFLPASCLLDLTIVLGIWTVFAPLASRFATSPIQAFCAVGLVGIAIPVGVAAALFGVYSIVGDMFSLALAQEFSGLGTLVLIREANFQIPMGAVVFGLASLVTIVLVHFSGRLESSSAEVDRQFQAPRARVLLTGLAVAVFLGLFTLFIASATASSLRYGFQRKVSGILLHSLAQLVTDFDRDGYGMLDSPVDVAPFDATIYPYAVDTPGNGVDENGLGGDHPAGFNAASTEIGQIPTTTGTATPHLLVIYLESFRADLLGRSIRGQEVTPFLNQLVVEGSSSRNAWVHAPWTLSSRAQFFSGNQVSVPGDPTLIDDFKSRGYFVAHFSGQDETYGASEALLGTHRADVFYHARHDLDLRTSRSTAPVSLQVSWKTLTRRVASFLEDRSVSDPLFLYVNIVDTHFPYTHTEIDDLLGVPELEREDIRSQQAHHVFEAYQNTAANVDRAVEEVVRLFRAAIHGADHGILVTADHGQSFYERGLLGHGQSLDPLETQIPFILWGIGGEWPELVAPSDVRGLLARNLGIERGSKPPRARFVRDANRHILQYASSIEKPRFIALRSSEEVLQYDFHKGEATLLDPTGALISEHLGKGALLQELIWRWEDVQRRALE